MWLAVPSNKQELQFLALVLSKKKNRQSQNPDLSKRFVVISRFFGPSTLWSTSFYLGSFRIRFFMVYDKRLTSRYHVTKVLWSRLQFAVHV